MSQLNGTLIISDGYTHWLLELVGIKDHDELIKRWTVYQILAETEFTVIVPNDKNRVRDALYYRAKYLRIPTRSLNLESPCSVLELLVSFTIRIVDDYIADDYSDSDYKKFFYELLKNLGLFNPPFVPSHIVTKIRIFIDRRYNPHNGYGGLFPLKERAVGTNMAEASLWDQMLIYISRRNSH